MSITPQTLEELSTTLTSSSSPAALLEALMVGEGELSLRLSDTPTTSNTEFLRTYYCAYFFALLLRNEINEARMLTLRIPRGLITADVTLQHTLSLLRAVWNKKHSLVYQILRQTAWPDILKPLAEAYFTYFRDKTLDDLSTAYGAIRPDTAASYLGFDLTSNYTMEDAPNPATTELVSALIQRGWEYDSEAKLLKPVPKATVASELDKVKIGQLAALLGTHGD